MRQVVYVLIYNQLVTSELDEPHQVLGAFGSKEDAVRHMLSLGYPVKLTPDDLDPDGNDYWQIDDSSWFTIDALTLGECMEVRI